MGAAAFLGSAALQLGGGLMASGASAKAGRMAQRIGEFNAQISEDDALEIRKAYLFEEIRGLESGKRAKGTLMARAGASGARLDVGAPLRAVAELAREINIDQLLIGYEGENAARRSENQAKVQRMGGELSAKQYNAQATAQLIRAGGTLLGNASAYQQNFGGTRPSAYQRGMTG